MSPLEPGAASEPRYIAEEDLAALSRAALGFGPYDPPWRVRDTRNGAIIEHGFRLEDGALGFAEALNRFVA
jgi:hypothetical protein